MNYLKRATEAIYLIILTLQQIFVKFNVLKKTKGKSISVLLVAITSRIYINDDLFFSLFLCFVNFQLNKHISLIMIFKQLRFNQFGVCLLHIFAFLKVHQCSSPYPSQGRYMASSPLSMSGNFSPRLILSMQSVWLWHCHARTISCLLPCGKNILGKYFK